MQPPHTHNNCKKTHLELPICRANVKAPAANMLDTDAVGPACVCVCVCVFSCFKTMLSISLFFELVGEGESGRLAATSTRGGTEGEARGPLASSGSKRGTNLRRCQQPATAGMGNLP